MVFLVTSYSSVSPSAPPSLHNSLYFNASFHILGSRLFIGMKSPRTRRGCNTARAFVAGCFAGSGAFPREGIARAATGLCPQEAAALKGWQRFFRDGNASAFWVGALMGPNLCKIGVRPRVLLCSDPSGSSPASGAPKTPVPGIAVPAVPAGLRGWALRGFPELFSSL